MDEITPINKKLNDFIYDKPDVVVVLLQQFGYEIKLKTATLSKITKLVYTALYVKQDKAFAEALDRAISNDGELNFATAIVSIFTSVIGGVFAAEEGRKNRDLQKELALAQLSMNEKLTEEKIRSDQEIARLTIMANSITENRATLYKESTARLKDTWLYVTGLGIGLGILFGVYLISVKE
jgi:hypothetical protein